MNLMPSPDPKTFRLLLLYCVLSTIFCFKFRRSAEQNAQAWERSNASLQHNSTLRSQDFPLKIWQTSKTNPAGLDEDTRRAIQTWIKLNSKHRYELVTDHSAQTYVRDRFADQPEILETFIDLQDPILRADLIRYLVLLGDGGVYSDTDTKSLKPIEDWVPPAFRDKANLVVGLEYDSRGQGRWVDWTLDLQFTNWAMMSKPGHLLLQITVDRVIGQLKKLAREQGKPISGIKASFAQVLDTTGPALFTEAIFEGLAFITGTNFTWRNVTGLTTPTLIGDVLLLPINAFGSGQAHSGSGSADEDSALLQHLFKGSWKGSHPFTDQSREDRVETYKEEEKRQEERQREERNEVERVRQEENTKVALKFGDSNSDSASLS